MAETKLEEMYPGNQKFTPSTQAKSPAKVIPTVKLEGSVSVRKKSVGRRLVDAFVGPDVVDVRSFIVNDVLIPATKNIVVDILDGFRDSIERALFGTSRGRLNQQNYGRPVNSSIVSYTPYWNGANNNAQKPTTVSYVGRNAPKDLIFTNNAEAAAVLNNLCDLIDTYGAVSVSNLNEMLGLPQTYTDTDWGWTNLSAACVRAVRGGYLLDLPKTMPLK